MKIKTFAFFAVLSFLMVNISAKPKELYKVSVQEKVKLNKDMCIGCGACCSIASENFTFDGATAKVINEEVTDQAKEARDCCPVGAISIEEETEN